MTAADQPSTTSTDVHSPASFLATAAALAAIDDALRDAQHETPDAAGPDPEQALASLMLLRQVREQLAGWETGLIEIARDEGASWADLAAPLGVASRQAAERRYLRGRPGAVGTTGEQRVTATRQARAAERATVTWARANATDLRRLAGQITALAHLAPEACSAQAALHAALDAADAAELIAPLTGMRPHLDAHHTGLIGSLDALEGRRTTTAADDDWLPPHQVAPCGCGPAHPEPRRRRAMVRLGPSPRPFMTFPQKETHMGSSVETMEFQAETRQLLRLVIHSIYSNKDIFLRELISNASDALDKLRLESLIDSSLADIDLHIWLEVDKDARTLTVRDNGIGMSRDDLVELIGTIAKSGTTGLLEKIKESKDAATAESLIGQFGVGFYSAFMVADKVTLRTRRAGTDSGTQWESDGEGTYDLQAVDDLPAGTSVTLHLKPTDSEDGLADYLSESKIRQIIKQYSDFIRWPIRMATERTDAEGETTRDIDTLNSMKALWARPRSEVTEDEYNDFYQQISHDWLAPAETIHMRAEGTFEYEALLFIPSQAPFDLFSRETKRGVQLYVKRVFIMDDCEALMPNYLRFVKGVVDAHDLSLNISREILQHDRQIHGVRRRLVKKVLGAIKDMQSKDAERYAKVWTQFGRALKEGLIEDTDNTDALLELVSTASTHDPEKTTTLREYLERMKDGQDTIYYLTGETRAMVENSPHMEAFAAKGYEVLILTDPIDEVWADRVPAFDGHRLQSIAKGQVDLDESADGDQETDATKAQREQDFAALLPWLTTTLSEQVKQVRLSSRLTTSAACIVGDAHDVTPTLEKMYRAMGQQLPTVKRILELNPAHPLITALRTAHDADANDPALAETAELIHGSALLAEGGDLPDPARFTRLLTDRLTRTL